MKTMRFRVPLKLKDRALASTTEGVTITDRSLPDNPIIYANKGFEDLTGYTAEEVMGLNCRFLQGAQTDPDTAEEIRRCIAEDRPCSVEILNHRKDGTPFWNRLSITPVRDSNGVTTHYIGVQTDITQRRNAEDQLRQARDDLEAANRRMTDSLAAAARIQRGLLPNSLPTVPGLQIAWQFRPCQQLAGDILNIVRLDDTHLGIYILDVSGHGVPAALLSFTLSSFLSGAPEDSPLYAANGETGRFRIATPVDVATRLNRRFAMSSRSSQFFTFLYGVLDTRIWRFDYVSAGHPPMLHLPADDRPAFIESPGFPIGVVPSPDYEPRRLDLRPGDRLLLYTDGLTEALNSDDLEFGRNRLMTLARARGAEPLPETLKEIVRHVKKWSRPRGLHDDASLIGLELTHQAQPVPHDYTI